MQAAAGKQPEFLQDVGVAVDRGTGIGFGLWNFVSKMAFALAAGLIAGEGLTGLLKALWKILFLQNAIGFDIPRFFHAGLGACLPD